MAAIVAVLGGVVLLRGETLVAQEQDTEPQAESAPITPDDFLLPPIPAGDQKYPAVVEARRKFDAGNIAEAQKDLEAAWNVNPELPTPYVMLARMAFARGQVSLGRSFLEEGVRNMSDDPEAYLVIGELAFRDGRYTEAELVLGKGRELLEVFAGNEQRKRAMQIHLNTFRSGLALVRQDWMAAEEHLRAWLELQPNVAMAHINLATALFQQQRIDEALAELELAAAANEDVQPADVALGIMYERAGDRAKAKESMDRALAKNPKDVRTLLGVANWMLSTGQFQDAKPLADTALEVEPNSLRPLLMAGAVARFLGERDAAEKYFEQAYLLSPANFQAVDQLALVLVESDDGAKKRRALELAETNARQYPSDPQVISTLGWVYYKHGRTADALRAFRMLDQAGRVNGDAAYYMAQIIKSVADSASSNQGANPRLLQDIQRLLQRALDSKTPFVHRTDAERMLADLRGAGAAPATP